MQYALDNIEFGQMNAVVKKLGGKEGVERFLRGELVVTDPANLAKQPRQYRSALTKVLADLLELTGDPIQLPAIERFDAGEKFRVDRSGELPISYLGDNFRNNFLGLVEEGVKAAKLKQRKLLKSSIDGPILSALGGEMRAKIAHAHAFEFLKTADRNRYYIFYVADKNGQLWAVLACWHPLRLVRACAFRRAPGCLVCRLSRRFPSLILSTLVFGPLGPLSLCRLVGTVAGGPFALVH